MAVDLAYVRELGAGLDEQVVVDLEAQRAHNVEVELREQVVDSLSMSKAKQQRYINELMGITVSQKAHATARSTKLLRSVVSMPSMA